MTKVRNIMALIGFGLLILAVSTADYYANEIGEFYPIRRGQIIIALLLVAPCLINLVYRIYKRG